MRVAVVGGGVVGLATARYLKKMGAEPFVVEAGVVGEGVRQGNLGWVCPSISTPLAAPGLTWKSLLWTLRRDSPLYVRPACRAQGCCRGCCVFGRTATGRTGSKGSGGWGR